MTFVVTGPDSPATSVTLYGTARCATSSARSSTESSATPVGSAIRPPSLVPAFNPQCWATGPATGAIHVLLAGTAMSATASVPAASALSASAMARAATEEPAAVSVLACSTKPTATGPKALVVPTATTDSTDAAAPACAIRRSSTVSKFAVAATVAVATALWAMVPASVIGLSALTATVSVRSASMGSTPRSVFLAVTTLRARVPTSFHVAAKEPAAMARPAADGAPVCSAMADHGVIGTAPSSTD